MGGFYGKKHSILSNLTVPHHDLMSFSLILWLNNSLYDWLDCSFPAALVVIITPPC